MFNRSQLLAVHFAFAFLFTLSGVAQHDCLSTKRGARTGLAKGGADTAWPWDILHQRIALDLTLGNNIAGRCTVTAVPRSDGATTLPLHLLALTVDSVILDGEQLAFTQGGILLEITLPTAFNTTDTVEMAIHYGGDPALDPSGFGGFYTSPSLTYNLGVAFQSIPHSYGRAWFPCVDNFTERNTYEFLVKTAGGQRSWCNGELLSTSELGGDTLISHWQINETMPAYLASVAAANYAEVHDTLLSASGEQVPVLLVASPSDTTAMKNSFIHLPDAFAHFEAWFGAYRWNKVGYVLTTQGAMEHSTSVHYPRSIVNGTTAYEEVMAHELAHQWFGDLVTCERAEEMYINEGFAEYLSYLFLEDVYGSARYMNVVRANHRRMVHQAHVIDDGWWALADVPQDHTYGEHSYNKGADVLHTLRAYLGDSLFKAGLTSFLNAFAFSPVNSTQLRDHLEQETGVPLSDFFADWILQPGWAAFEVDGFTTNPTPLPGGVYSTSISIAQKQRGPSQPYSNVPITVTCFSAIGERWTDPQPHPVGGTATVIATLPPFIPQWIVLNADERISQAVTMDQDTLFTPTTLTYANADLRLTVNTTPSPIPVVLEEYWVAADQETDAPFAFVVSPDRYWRITAAFPPEASISARFSYDGRTNVNTALDEGLMQSHPGVQFHEDSLVLLYRPDASWPWSVFPDQLTGVLGNPTDKIGRIDADQIQAGEYVLAWRKSAVGSNERGSLATTWTIGPNPAQDHFTVRTDGTRSHGTISLRDMGGRLARWQMMQGDASTISLAGIAAGTYSVAFADADGVEVPVGKLVVKP